MTSPELARLRAQQQALTAQLAQGLANDSANALPLSELSDVHARLQLVNGAIDAHAPVQPPARANSRALHRHVLALIVVAGLVTLAALLPMPRASFSLEVDAGAVQLRMQDKGSLAGQGMGSELRAEGFERIESADLKLLERASGGAANQIGLRAERLSLRRVGFPAAATLEFEAGTPTVRLAVDGSPHSAEFEVTGAVTSTFGGAPREASNYPVVEWIKLLSGAASTQIWMTLGAWAAEGTSAASRPQRSIFYRLFVP